MTDPQGSEPTITQFWLDKIKAEWQTEAVAVDRARLGAEIAGYRAIEEAARAYRAARDARRAWAEAHGYIINAEFDALRDAESEADDTLRAALEEKR
jgi:hypothetical protein